MPHLRWLAVAVFSISVMLNALDRNLLAALQPSVRSQFGLDSRSYGELVASFSLVYGVSAPLLGWLLDRFGLTLVSTLAVGLWSLASVMTGFSSSFGELLFWRGVLGFAESAAIPASGKAFALFLEPRQRSVGTAINQIGLTAGSVGAVLLAGWLAPRMGWRAAFLLAGPLGWAWIPVWLWMSRRAKGLAAASPSAPEIQEKDKPTPWKIIRNPKLWALAIANVLIMMLYSLWTNWTTAYLVRERGLAESEANLMFAWIPPVLATIGGLCGGWAVMQMKSRPVSEARFRVCATASVLLLVTVAIPLLPTTLLATVAIGMSFFLTLVISVNLYAIPLDLFGADGAGFAMGVITCSYGLMQAVISPQIGRMVDAAGFQAICLVGAFCPMLGMLILWSQKLHRVHSR